MPSSPADPPPVPLPVDVPPAPPAPRRDLVEVIHGVDVADPFRNLEDGSSERTRAWVRAQNDRTEAVLAQLGDRGPLRARLAGLLGAGVSAAGAVAGDRVLTLERWAPLDQTVLVVRPTAAPGPARTVVDPVAGPPGAGPDPTGAIDWYRPSRDGRLVAYGRSTGGDERSTLHVVDVDTGEHLTDRVPHTRACSLAWSPDGTGFAYTRYPDPADVPPGEADYWRRIYWHRLGGDWHDDELVWDDLPDPTAFASVDLSPDGRWTLVHVSLGWSRVDVHLIDRATGGRTPVIEGIDSVSAFSFTGDRLVGHTTLDADRGRVVAASPGAPAPGSWHTLVPESERVIGAVVATSDSLLVASSLDAVSYLDRYDPDGSGHRPVELPEPGSLAGLDASPERDEAFFSFTSFTRPATLFRWTPDGVATWSHLPGSESRDGYVVERLTYPSLDGTEIPLLVVRAAATVPGPATPCVLSGYGGFSLSMSPAYSASVVAVCDDGGLFAVPALRGGGERGESWHEAGRRERKQTTFDDFLAAADWLVTHGWTSPGRLAIRGGSNGGLLMAAAITQRPDLCRAAHLAVPLTDMVRYPRFLIGRLWVPEYGDPDEAADLSWLHAYSPYHRVAGDVCYPAVILTHGRGDSRVDPLHARKMAARLQEATSCGDARPVLLREEDDAGHGQGKPVTRQAEELADVLAFLRWQLGWDVHDDPARTPVPPA